MCIVCSTEPAVAPGFVGTTTASNSLGVRNEDEVSVFVDVAQVGEGFKPLASVVRLQLLDRCDVGGIQSAKESFVTFESLWSALDRKLCLLAGVPAVQALKIDNKVVKRSAITVGCIADEDTAPIRDGGEIVGCNLEQFSPLARLYRTARLRLDINGLSLSLTGSVVQRFQFKQVFCAPRYPQIGVS
jgi:hypothetical protein